MQRVRNTKIVATLGPSSNSRERIGALLEAGVEVFRLNASHGSRESHGELIRLVREASRDAGREVGILMDLQGPKIRLGLFENGGCVLETGSVFTITTAEVMGNAQIASTSYTNFARDVQPGNRVLLADGAIELAVLDSDAVKTRCKVVSGGPVSDRKGINLPGVSVSSPSLTKKDMADLTFGLAAGIDLVALSFVRSKEDMLRLRLFLENQDAKLPLIAKIEKPEGWANLDGILEESDGVMVARGDLGVEISLEKVPLIQKSIIRRARDRGRFVITATQMLESMIDHPLPTRADVSDVANAIYDGTDAVMLSGETSAGKFPVEAVTMMARIAREAEDSASSGACWKEEAAGGGDPSAIVSGAACRAAQTVGAKAIVLFTASGSTARLVARYRPAVPVYAVTASSQVARLLSPVYGIRPLLVESVESTDEMIALVDRLLVEKCRFEKGSHVVFLAGLPLGSASPTNAVMLRRIK